MIKAKLIIKTNLREVVIEQKAIISKQDINDLLWSAREILTSDLEETKKQLENIIVENNGDDHFKE